MYSNNVKLASLLYFPGEAAEDMGNGDGFNSFTVGIFADVPWATRGLSALIEGQFPLEDVSVLAKSTPEVDSLVEKTFGIDRNEVELDIELLGQTLAHGTLVDALQGDDDGLTKTGLAATMRRAGFQSHDGFIFETLMGRGGILVAIHSESRAADALALLHSYGGGNAAIGAWRGRV